VAGVAAADDEERRKLVDIWLTATFGFKNRLFKESKRFSKDSTRSRAIPAAEPQPFLNRADGILRRVAHESGKSAAAVGREDPGG
jgi:hypothetical protein